MSSENTSQKYNTRSAVVKAATTKPVVDNKAAKPAVNKKAKAAVKPKPIEAKPQESSDDDDEEEVDEDEDFEEDDEEEEASETEAIETDASETDASETEASETDASETEASETEASETETDEDYIASADEDEVDEALKHHEYQKFLSELFPSNYSSGKAKMASIEHKKSSNTKCPGAPKKQPRKCLLLDSGDDDEDMDDLADVVERKSKKNTMKSQNPMKNFNISFIINDARREGGGHDYISDREALYDEAYTDTSSSETEEDETSSESEEEDEIETPRKTKKRSAGASKAAGAGAGASASEACTTGSTTTTDELASFAKMKGLFESLSAKEREDPIIKKMLDEIKEKEKRFVKKAEQRSKKQKVDNTKKLKTLLRERDVMNDLQYFNEKMSVAQQEHALKQIEEIKKHNDITKPYRLTLLDADIPSQYKAIAYRKISSLRSMEPGGGDYYKMKNWVDTFMQIPFGKYRNLPITIADGVEKCHEFMDNAKQILDQAVYGLNDAKLQIMQMVGQWIVNPSAIGTAIAIKGPMGTGKTTLVKEGISKILGRDFVFIALGGATDSSFLEGHSYTYEGSTWGKIVDLLIKCKSMNPVIYFDELDKISDTPKGEEIAGILTHLTDTAQNNQFHDRYFSEIEFDLSRCLFIFSYNDESKVNKILLDRMYRIQTQGYNQEQKTTISNKYLLPKICEQVKFQTADIIISDETLHYIITNYTDKEDGVRTLKRCLEIIYTKLNLYRLMRPDTNIFESEMSIKVEFPMQVTKEIVDKLIKKTVDNGSWHNMYM